ncbi:hypothetical protein BDV36DRAFT_55115 [Aspergillus pseudocaelatus]|uniref:Uncharacterized protein n=1 Tax=Aspergillus pseudocaelatus TaxID=1825620 RepID=A0ABQ6W678_9EURO|nr:hypothetical protein BDV36DRAFT_55115 [Aspergillus pseudocaelatus]
MRPLSRSRARIPPNARASAPTCEETPTNRVWTWKRPPRRLGLLELIGSPLFAAVCSSCCGFQREKTSCIWPLSFLPLLRSGY